MNSEPACVAPTGEVCDDGVVWHAAHAAAYWTDVTVFWSIALRRQTIASARGSSTSR